MSVYARSILNIKAFLIQSRSYLLRMRLLTASACGMSKLQKYKTNPRLLSQGHISICILILREYPRNNRGQLA